MGRVTSDRLRSDIDGGRTGDKVPWPDPAAAPLGTDDEAAGHGPDGARLEAAHRAEVQARRDSPQHGPQGRRPVLIAIALVVAAAVLALLAAI